MPAQLAVWRSGVGNWTSVQVSWALIPNAAAMVALSGYDLQFSPTSAFLPKDTTQAFVTTSSTTVKVPPVTTQVTYFRVRTVGTDHHDVST